MWCALSSTAHTTMSTPQASQQTKLITARHAHNLLLVVEDTWTLFWELLKQHPQSTMADLCQAKIADWCVRAVDY